MKFIEAVDSPMALPTIELTRRNLEVLLAKLDDSLSRRTIIKDGYAVKAVEDGPFLPDPGLTLIADRHAVTAVENDEHYSDREPGPMFMPSSGETI